MEIPIVPLHRDQSGHVMTVGRVRLALGVACASAMSLALGAVQSPWGKSHQPRYGPAVGVVAPVNPAPLQRALPDEVGGIVSSHLCVRVKPGVVVARLADGTWSMHRHGAQPDAMNAGFADAQPAQDEIALRGVLAQHQVTDIRPFVNHQFRRADLAAKYGLDRTWIAHVAPGADVVAINAAQRSSGAVPGTYRVQRTGQGWLACRRSQ
jgi:hypothetical protein